MQERQNISAKHTGAKRQTNICHSNKKNNKKACPIHDWAGFLLSPKPKLY
jgi:hypothetical protein